MKSSTHIWGPRELAEYLGVPVSWVYDQARSDCADPIPRCAGFGRRLKFNTRNGEFREWLARKIGDNDLEPLDFDEETEEHASTKGEASSARDVAKGQRSVEERALDSALQAAH